MVSRGKGGNVGVVAAEHAAVDPHLHSRAATASEALGAVAHALPAEPVRIETSTRAEVEALLLAEARLLDDGRFEEWLGLYSRDAFWWVPCDDNTDPRSELSLVFDDRGRMEQRLARLRSGFAYSQLPASRTQRVLGPVEVHPGGHHCAYLAVSNVVLHELRAHKLTVHPARCIYMLDRDDGTLQIVGKKVELLLRGEVLDNLTFPL